MEKWPILNGDIYEGESDWALKDEQGLTGEQAEGRRGLGGTRGAGYTVGQEDSAGPEITGSGMLPAKLTLFGEQWRVKRTSGLRSSLSVSSEPA